MALKPLSLKLFHSLVRKPPKPKLGAKINPRVLGARSGMRPGMGAHLSPLRLP